MTDRLINQSFHAISVFASRLDGRASGAGFNHHPEIGKLTAIGQNWDRADEASRISDNTSARCY